MKVALKTNYKRTADNTYIPPAPIIMTKTTQTFYLLYRPHDEVL